MTRFRQEIAAQPAALRARADARRACSSADWWPWTYADLARPGGALPVGPGESWLNLPPASVEDAVRLGYYLSRHIEPATAS